MKPSGTFLFPHIAWCSILLVPFVFLGFYSTYFSRLFTTSLVLHLHFVFLSLWVIMAISQPLLINFKNLRLHRLVGKISYLVMPGVIITTWIVIRNNYLSATSDGRELDLFARQALIVPIIYLVWLVVLYGLAVFYRKKILYHATFMFSAVLTVLGPTIDRILFQVYQYYSIGLNYFAEFAVFLLIDMILLSLLYYQSSRNLSLKPVSISLIIYFAGQVGYLTLPHSKVWMNMLEYLM